MTKTSGPALPYATPQALLAAITDKIASVVGEGSVYNHDELRRHFAYDRLLARVFSNDPERWVLKGGGALLARIPDARHSKDLDIAFAGNDSDATKGISAAMGALTEAAAVDLGDFFVFAVGNVKGELKGANQGVSLPVGARIGPKQFASFGVDLVLEAGLTTTPDYIAPLAPIDIEGLAKVKYRAYPIVDHLADKHAAMLETHNGSPSTRYRDLVDIVEIATHEVLIARQLSIALFSKYLLRGLRHPERFESPGPDWPDGYAKVAETVPAFAEMTFEQAMGLASALFDPILAGRNSGAWDPDVLAWGD